MKWLAWVGIFWCAAHAQEPPKEKPKAPEPPAASSGNLNLLGKADTESGESKRNENVQFNLVDNNALKESNLRLGTRATLHPKFEAPKNYFGGEFGNNPPARAHVAGQGKPDGFHATLFATHLNSVFSARTFFQVGDVLPARENQYGLAVSFAAGKWGWLTLEGAQHKIRGQVNGNALVPKAEERQVFATDPAVRRLLERWIAAYPLAAPNRPDINERALNTNAPQEIDTDNTMLRWERKFGTKDRVTARHAWTTQVIDAFQFVAGQNPDTSTRSHAARLTWDRAWTARTNVTATLGFDRVHSLLAPEPNAVGPQVQVGTAYTTLGPGANVPLDRVQNRYRNAVMLSRTAGKHRMVAGWEVARLQFNGREASSNRSNVYFRNDFGFDAIRNFRDGRANRFTTGIGEMHRGFRNWEQEYFFGDTWQVQRRLTLDLGIRYEPVTGPYEVNGLTQIPFRCDCNNWAPRIGFAWRTAARGVLRGAYGVHFGEMFAVTLQQLRWNPPNFLKIEVNAPASILNPLAGVDLSGVPRSTLFVVPDNLRSPYSHQYNLSWETELPKRARLSLGYVGSRTHKLFYMWHTNRAWDLPGVPFTSATINERRVDPRFYEVRRVSNMSRAYFDAARVNVTVPDWHGMTVDASYWFSKAIDLGGAYTNTAAGDDSRNGVSQTESVVQSDLKGVSLFDQSHAAMVRWRYSIPGPNAVRALRGWHVSAVWLAKSGLPFTVLTGSDAPGFGNSDGASGDRPMLLDPSVLGARVNHPDVSRERLPVTAFRGLRRGEAAGNLGFNTFRRGGIRNLNASLDRDWRIAGERRLTLRAESVNFTNTPQFADPNTDWTNPAFGMITNTLNEGRSVSFTLQLRW